MRFKLKKTVFYILVFIFTIYTLYTQFFGTDKQTAETQRYIKLRYLNNFEIHQRQQTSIFSRQNISKIWFNFSNYDDDRIVAQMSLIPKSIVKLKENKKEVPFKTILVFGNAKNGIEYYNKKMCPVSNCKITKNKYNIDKADVVLTQHQGFSRGSRSPQSQIWVMYLLESPYHTPRLNGYKDMYNWTATYRHDSDIVTPYAKFVPFDDSVPSKSQQYNYAKGKTKQIAWFVSNCGASNNRMKYAKELGKYMQVDIYGNCGKLKCWKRKSDECFQILNRDYKFYLAFENSNCRDYITEKFFLNGLQHDIIPIVMGAAPEDYERVAPPHSFIHVDYFESPKELAQYLTILDKNDSLFNEYFRWKGTGSFVNTLFWCRLCAIAHEAEVQTSVYHDLEKWWRGPDVCIGKDSWRKRPRTSKYIVTNYKTNE